MVATREQSTARAVVGVLGACLALAACSGEPAPSSLDSTVSTPVSPPTATGSCPVSNVRREAIPEALGWDDRGPATWIGDNTFAAVLFYSSEGSPTMTVGGRMPDGRNTKVLWLVPNPAEGQLEVRGSTPDGATLSQRFDGAGNYPSILIIPAPGCWTFSISVGREKQIGSITVPVVPKPA